MTIVSIKTGTESELKRIELSDGSLFSLRTCYLAGCSPGTRGAGNLGAAAEIGHPGDSRGGGDSPAEILSGDFLDGFMGGEEISAGEADAFRFAAACLRAERAALRLITRAEQTTMGLSRKLERRGFDTACVRAVIRRLAVLEIVDDRRFACLWLHSRLSRRAESPRRLLAGLRGRGIGREDADAALKSALNFRSESALLRNYIEKNRLTPETGEAGSLSLKYRLKGEGFSVRAVQDYWEEQGW
jgi:regulatory protein